MYMESQWVYKYGIIMSLNQAHMFCILILICDWSVLQKKHKSIIMFVMTAFYRKTIPVLATVKRTSWHMTAYFNSTASIQPWTVIHQQSAILKKSHFFLDICFAIFFQYIVFFVKSYCRKREKGVMRAIQIVQINLQFFLTYYLDRTLTW